MGDSNQNSSLFLKKNFDGVVTEGLNEKFELVSLKDVPLEVRREEAKKPLFLTRYE